MESKPIYMEYITLPMKGVTTSLGKFNIYISTIFEEFTYNRLDLFQDRY